MGLSNGLSCEAGNFSCRLIPHRFFRDFETLCPCAGTLGCVVCLTCQSFLLVYPHTNVGLPALPANTHPPRFSSHCLVTSPLCPWLPVSAPPTGLDECFFFNSLVVRLPYSLIFQQLQSFFVFKFVVLLVVQGGEVYLPMPPSWSEVYSCSYTMFSTSLFHCTLVCK